MIVECRVLQSKSQGNVIFLGQQLVHRASRDRWGAKRTGLMVKINCNYREFLPIILGLGTKIHFELLSQMN